MWDDAIISSIYSWCHIYSESCYLRSWDVTVCDVLSSAAHGIAVQSKKAVSAYFTSKQILPFHCLCRAAWWWSVWVPTWCWSIYTIMLRCKAKRQYLITSQVRRSCLCSVEWLSTGLVLQMIARSWLNHNLWLKVSAIDHVTISLDGHI